MKWVTRERPKIDRIACQWLFAGFIADELEFNYVRTSRVREVAAGCFSRDPLPMGRL